MSALPPKADILRCGKGTLLFDHLVGTGEERRRQRQTDCLGRCEIDNQFKFGWLLDGNIAGLRTT